MKVSSRLMIALACGAIVAFFGAAPALSAPTGSYAATADGTGLTLALFAPGSDTPALSLDVGITHGVLDSIPHVTGEASGIVQVDTATTVAPPDAEDTVSVVDQDIGDPETVGIHIDLIKGVSESLTSVGPATHNRGEIVGAEIRLSPLLGTPPFAVASESNIDVTPAAVTSEAHSDEVVIPLELGREIVSPLCDVLGGLSPPLGDACDEATSGVEPLVTVFEVRILPAAVECVLDQATNTASVPTATAALLEITLFPGTVDEQTISVSLGQTIDIGTGTPLAIHAVVGDTATSVDGATATATASALRLDLLDDPLPRISIVASESSCTVTGTPQTIRRPPPAVLPETGAPLGLVYGAGGLMVAIGLGLTRLLRRAA
jgi:hypothetical protein